MKVLGGTDSEVEPRGDELRDELREVGSAVVPHRDGVTGDNGGIELALRRERGHHLDEPGLVIVDLIAVHVDGDAVLLGKLEDHS
jgi:hypothetical protein